jgi:hypothetical protein
MSVQIQKWVPQCEMAWPLREKVSKRIGGGWGPHDWVFVGGKRMEGNM